MLYEVITAMEQALLPQVIETFDAIAGTYKKLARRRQHAVGEDSPPQLHLV